MRQSQAASLSVPTAEAMREIGKQLGHLLARDQIAAQCVFLEGELGAGKTTLVGGILAGFGIQGPVRSPTYTLIEPYEVAGRQLFHIDLYRLTDPDEIEPLGLRDLLVPGAVLLVEWPSRAGQRIPAPDLDIKIDYALAPGDGRLISLAARNPILAAVLEPLLA